MIKKHKALLAYMLVLAVFTTYVIMDTFVISRVYGEGSGSGTEAATQLEGETDSGSVDNGGTEQGTANSEQGTSDSKHKTQGSDRESADLGQDTGENGHKHGPGSGSKGTPPSGGHGPGSGSKGTPPSGGHSPKNGSSKSSDSDTESSSSSEKSASGSTGTSASTVASTAASTQDSYQDDNVSINLKEYNSNGTTVHVAEVSSDSQTYLKTAFAQGSYGKNVTATTSDIADSVDAILAINGDYYGAREKGYVIRNGELYRNTANAGAEDLVIYKDGSFGIINESEVSAEELLEKGAVQTLSFGPALIENGKVSVDSDDEVGRAMGSNPRTAIGIKSDGTYIFVVSDGRTDESEGLSLLELAEFMSSLGVETAYNLDGGGSSTMVFNGDIVNTPTGGGIGNGSGSERKVSDIVYIGY